MACAQDMWVEYTWIEDTFIQKQICTFVQFVLSTKKNKQKKTPQWFKVSI